MAPVTSLAGRVAVVTGRGAGLGDGSVMAGGLAAALARAGAIVHDDFVGVDRLDVVVDAFVPPVALERVPFIEVDEARWAASCEDLLEATLRCLQSAFPLLRERGGRIVVVTTTVAMTGGSGLAPYAAAAEGRRALAKSAARQWGKHGITVNCLAPAPPDPDTVSIADRALDTPGDPELDLGPVVAFLAGDDARFVTGQTIVVDGGLWMAP
jgi:NAD(P)-dependent dehydrogenase (short-subunit alcohol dehydrogenase family)